ncbi:type II toxin-antitoxin system RelE/ParE family toxin [Limibacterium fermenti]|uniref:type II toxin-antitoxin system RelE/ParE family toxin n=1 Tax=Limibacterium fermenti TaxID=3229863 RepID=UPI003A6F2842
MDTNLAIRKRIHEFVDRAENDLSKAVEWYESRQKGLELIFLNKVQEYLESIQQNSLQYPLKRSLYREVFLRKFPYIIIYEVREGEVGVYSIFHTHRNPDSRP